MHVKAHVLKLCCCFYFLLPVSMCIDVNFILAMSYRNICDNWQPIMSHMCQLITHLQLFTREDTATKNILVINAYIAVGLQLLEMSYITTPNQTILDIYLLKQSFNESLEFCNSS